MTKDEETRKRNLEKQIKWLLDTKKMYEDGIISLNQLLDENYFELSKLTKNEERSNNTV